MKQFWSVFLMMAISVSFAQDDEGVYSLYFSVPLVDGNKELTTIKPIFYGSYGLQTTEENALRSAAGDVLQVDETGVYLEKNKLLSISKAEVRENSAYTVKNGYLFGVVEGDSVMTAFQDDAYYFLIPSKTYLYAVNNTDFKLFEGLNSQQLVVFTKEKNENYYTTLVVQFNAGAIELKELDLNHPFYDARKVADQKIKQKGMSTYVVNPTAAEWQKILNCYVVYDRYAVIAED